MLSCRTPTFSRSRVLQSRTGRRRRCNDKDTRTEATEIWRALMNEHWMERNGVTLWWGWRAFALQPGWWQAMLAVARQHGWTPSGTRPPLDYWGWRGDPATWDGRYWPGGGQQMTKEDARAFGAALGCALADIPDHDAMPASWPGSWPRWSASSLANSCRRCHRIVFRMFRTCTRWSVSVGGHAKRPLAGSSSTAGAAGGNST
jgi:hypothetical protein